MILSSKLERAAFAFALALTVASSVSANEEFGKVYLRGSRNMKCLSKSTGKGKFMRSKLITALLSCLILLTLPVHAADKEFDSFWLEFKQALQQNDQQKIVSLTKTPFYYQDKNLDKTHLLPQLSKIFTPKVRKCLVKQRPVGDSKEGYSGFCGEIIYIFSKVNGHYLFTDLGVND